MPNIFWFYNADDPDEVEESLDQMICHHCSTDGKILTVNHCCALKTSYHAQLEPADQDEDGELWEVHADTREEVEAAVAAELSRRAAIAEAEGRDHG